mgnify:CR=1 FL=1
MNSDWRRQNALANLSCTAVASTMRLFWPGDWNFPLPDHLRDYQLGAVGAELPGGSKQLRADLHVNAFMPTRRSLALLNPESTRAWVRPLLQYRVCRAHWPQPRNERHFVANRTCGGSSI